MQIPLSHYSWLLWGESWGPGLWAIGLRPQTSFYFPFNFGIFAAFWSAYMGVARLGGTMVSGGGLDTAARIKQILDYKPQAMFATPTYALHFGETAKKMGVDLRQTSIAWVIVAGEPGGSIPTTRQAISDLWQAQVHDLYGVAELGPTHYGCPQRIGLHLHESLYHSLIVDAQGQPVPDGEVGENIMTSYVQHMQPLIKYRTHDLLRWHSQPCACGRTARFYDGGVLGRTDHMLTIRGTNVYPTAVEALLSAVPALSEHYEIHASLQDNTDAVDVKVEARPGVEAARYAGLGQQMATILHEAIKVRIGVEVVPPDTLPRYELKAKRFFDHRPAGRGWQIRERTRAYDT
jgi:phenylacetate-CoA ligase